MTLSTLELNYVNLTPSQKEYFQHLAADSQSSDPIDYFQQVPSELRSDPAMVEYYLNGHPELGVSDKDWSHIESKANGGSNEADNGFFEDQSTNRSRGADNVTPEEAYAAESADEEEVASLLDTASDVAEASGWATAVEIAGGAGEVALDFLAPAIGGAVAGKAVFDSFEEPKDKWGWGSLTGGVTALILCTPPGQIAVAGFVGYKLVRRGSKLINKHFPA